MIRRGRKRFSYKRNFPSVADFLARIVSLRGVGFIDYVAGITKAVYKTPSVFSATSWMVKYRNGVRRSDKLTKDEVVIILEHTRLPRHIIKIRNKLESDALIKRQRNNLIITNSEDMIDVAIKLLTSDQWSRRAVAIALLTGRRFIEIVKVGNFKESKSSPYHILFSGQAKTSFKKTYVFPLCTDKVNAKEVIKSINRIRNEWTIPKGLDKKDNYESSFVGGATVRQTARYWFPQVNTFKDLRGVYGAICYNKFAKDKITETRYLSDILGHHHTDLKSGMSYAVYKIK